VRRAAVIVRSAVLASVAALAACAASGTSLGGSRAALLPPAGLARSFSYGDHEEAAADIRAAAELLPGDQLRLPVRLEYDIDGATMPWIDGLLWSMSDPDGDQDSSATSELIYGLQRRLRPPDSSQSGWPLVPAMSATGFIVSPHGNPKPARWQGVIESQEGYFGVLTSEWGNADNNLHLDLGGGVGGRPGEPGHSGRLIGGLGYTLGLASPGFGHSTEPMRLGIETSWVHDPVDDRTFGELGLGFSVWVGTFEIDAGYRRGLTGETHDDVFYVGFRTRFLDTFMF
jgi:hypothetical protein